MASVNLDTSAKLNITCRRGDTFTLEVDFGEAVNTSGWSFKVKNREQVREDKRVAQKKEVSTLSVDDGGIVISAGTATGTSIDDSKATITIDASQMSTIVPGVYTYDLQNSTSGTVKTYIFGSFKVNSDV